jgi:FkbM family methyltransferase
VNLARARELLFSDPGLFCRKSAARIIRRVPLFPRRAVRNIRGVRFECDLTLDARVADMLFAAYEPDEIAVLERHLKTGDVFVDVGANIGYLTAVGASLVGPTGQVHSFEPVPEYFQRLESLRAANPGYSIHVNRIALGERSGTAEIAQAADGNIGWNTMVPGLLLGDSARARHSVPIQRLDAYLTEHGITKVALLKVDAEGFELPVLRGASGFLETAKRRPAILCEVAPGAYPLLGARVGDLFDMLGRFGYSGFDVEHGGRPIAAASVTVTTNVLFLAAT